MIKLKNRKKFEKPDTKKKQGLELSLRELKRRQSSLRLKYVTNVLQERPVLYSAHQAFTCKHNAELSSQCCTGLACFTKTALYALSSSVLQGHLSCYVTALDCEQIGCFLLAIGISFGVFSDRFFKNRKLYKPFSNFSVCTLLTLRNIT